LTPIRSDQESQPGGVERVFSARRNAASSWPAVKAHQMGPRLLREVFGKPSQVAPQRRPEILKKSSNKAAGVSVLGEQTPVQEKIADSWLVTPSARLRQSQARQTRAARYLAKPRFSGEKHMTTLGQVF